MAHPRSNHPGPPESSGGLGKVLMLAVVFLLLVGLCYLFFQIQLTMVKSRFASALQEKVMDTVQYANVNGKRVHQRIKVAFATAKLKATNAKQYVTIADKDDFQELGSYYLRSALQRHRAVAANRTDNIPGCSMTDAMPPDLTLRKLAGAPSPGRKSLTNRVQGMSGNDAQAVVSGTKSRTRAPDGSMVLAVDITMTYAFLFFKKKLWFHRRCFFFKKRRPATAHNEHKALLGIKGDDS